MKNTNFENLDTFTKLTSLAPKYLNDPQITVGQLVEEYDFKPSEVLLLDELLCEYLQTHPKTYVQLQPGKFYTVIDQTLMHNVTQPKTVSGRTLAAFREIYALDLNHKYNMIIDANFQMIYPILTQAFIQHALAQSTAPH